MALALSCEAAESREEEGSHLYCDWARPRSRQSWMRREGETCAWDQGRPGGLWLRQGSWHALQLQAPKAQVSCEVGDRVGGGGGAHGIPGPG